MEPVKLLSMYRADKAIYKLTNDMKENYVRINYGKM